MSSASVPSQLRGLVGTLRAEGFEQDVEVVDHRPPRRGKGRHAMLLRALENKSSRVDAMLGSTLLASTQPHDFLGIDLWTNDANMAAFYGDPAFAKAFGALFAPPGPSLELFAHQPGWHQWGDMHSGDAYTDHWFVVARGHLASSDPATNQAVHDLVAATGEPQVTAVGDVAHVVFTGLDDPQEFLAIDIWSDDTYIEAVYTDPAFVKGFSLLFDQPATVQVYHSTDWHQW